MPSPDWGNSGLGKVWGNFLEAQLLLRESQSQKDLESSSTWTPLKYQGISLKVDFFHAWVESSYSFPCMLAGLSDPSLGNVSQHFPTAGLFLCSGRVQLQLPFQPSLDRVVLVWGRPEEHGRGEICRLEFLYTPSLRNISISTNFCKMCSSRNEHLIMTLDQSE